jgi:capsular polysaccharide biosynthesis protein
MKILNRQQLRHVKQTIKKMVLGEPPVTLDAYFTQWLLKEDYVKQYPARWHQAYANQPTNWLPPKVYGQQKANFKPQLTRRFSSMGVLEISNGSVVTKNGWIVGENNILLPEFSIFQTDIRNLGHNVRLPTKTPNIQKLSGCCASLVSTWPGNYYHCLLDSLPRFHLLQQAGFKLTDIDWVYCPPATTPNTEYLLSQLGFKPSQLIPAADDIGIQADTLLAVSFPGARHNPPEWAVDFLRQIAHLPNHTPSRRLYITRGKWSRKLLNESATFEILQQYGFEFYDPDENENQALDFNQAEIIVAPHGAALANIVFCQPGAKLLELIPTDHPFAYFYTLSQSANLQYAYMMGDSVQVRKKRIAGPSHHDFSIDLDIFGRAIADFIFQ